LNLTAGTRRKIKPILAVSAGNNALSAADALSHFTRPWLLWCKNAPGRRGAAVHLTQCITRLSWCVLASTPCT